MNNTRFLPLGFVCTLLCATLIVVAGCGTPTSSPPPTKVTKQRSFPANLKLEVNGEQRRVLLDAVVPDHEHGEQYLEFFLSTKKGGRGYESVLVADVDARKLHEALLTAGAVPGAPFRVDPYQLPRGQILRILLRYETKDGRQVTDVAQSWLRTRDGGEVHLNWVYTGSRFSDDDPQPNQPRVFLAERDGTLITLGNTETALIDVSIPSSAHMADLDMTYNTDRIPPPGTKVTVIFEPVGEYKKDQK
jgi:hypothetical protein